MKGFGSGLDSEWTFLDVLSVMSFLISMKNLDLNVTQEDAQRLQTDFAEKTDLLLKEIHGHLEEQDKKLNYIIKEVEKNDN
jgi:hypothetical protein